MKFIERAVKPYRDHLYFVFRVLVGFLFFQHGAQKLFGWFGGNQVETVFSLMGAAGIIEFFGGAFIALGLLTRLAALFGAAHMGYVYLTVHLPNGLIPIVNKGELALLFFAFFLVFIAYGGRKWSLENVRVSFNG